MWINVKYLIIFIGEIIMFVMIFDIIFINYLAYDVLTDKRDR